jgi:hypothetical protein
MYFLCVLVCWRLPLHMATVHLLTTTVKFSNATLSKLENPKLINNNIPWVQDVEFHLECDRRHIWQYSVETVCQQHPVLPYF